MRHETQEIEIPQMLTTAAAAAALLRSPQTLRLWACTGRGPIQPVRIRKNGPLLWRKSDIDQLLNQEHEETTHAA